MQPVENIVDLLALHLGVDAMSEELVARLKERWQPGEIKYLTRSGTRASPSRLFLTSVLTCMTPSSVRVLVSMTGIPSADRSAKIF